MGVVAERLSFGANGGMSMPAGKFLTPGPVGPTTSIPSAAADPRTFVS